MTLNFPSLQNNFVQSDALGEGMGSNLQEQIKADSDAVPGVPIGAIIAWAKTLSGAPILPDNFVQCDGQTLSDGDSPFNGQTIPSLNAGLRFLRGNTTSGGTGGSETHVHTNPTTAVPSATTTVTDDGSNQVTIATGTHTHTQGDSGSFSTLPTYYQVVWIMRIK